MLLLTNLATTLVLSTALLLNILIPACSKAQTQATMQDVIDTLAAGRGRIVSDFPDFTAKYNQLQSLANSIKIGLDSVDSLKVKDLVKSFLPLFEELTAKLGVNKKLLDVVDIGIHIVLNHLPISNSTRASRDADSDSILLQYKSKQVWGCETKPQLCKQLN